MGKSRTALDTEGVIHFSRNRLILITFGFVILDVSGDEDARYVFGSTVLDGGPVSVRIHDQH